MATSQNGWPVIESGTDPRLVTIPKIVGRVRAGDVATIFSHLIDQFDRHVEDVDAGADDWGYAYRPIRGTTSGYSNHASGTAIDLNATRHPIGKRATFTPHQITMIRTILARYEGTVRWGGDYADRPDEMHFEINADPARVARVATSLTGGTMTAVSPLSGRFTYGYKDPRYRSHLGIDIAPPKPGQYGPDMKVRAMCAGRVKFTESGRKPGQKTTNWRARAALGTYATGNMVAIERNGFEVYNHITPLVKVGEWVNAGDVIGYLDRSGNQSGPHLHMETYVRRGVTYDPMILFRKHGLAPGDTPKVLTGVKAPAPEAVKPLDTSRLFVDGRFGPTTIKALQQFLTKHGFYAGKIDGSFGPFTVKGLQRFLKKWNYYTGAIDGSFGPLTIKALQRMLTNHNCSPGRIDGTFGPLAVKGLQRYLNNNR